MPLLSLDSRARVRVVTTAILFACLNVIEQQSSITSRQRQDRVSSSSSRRMVRLNTGYHQQRKPRYWKAPLQCQLTLNTSRGLCPHFSHKRTQKDQIPMETWHIDVHDYPSETKRRYRHTYTQVQTNAEWHLVVVVGKICFFNDTILVIPLWLCSSQLSLFTAVQLHRS